MTAPETNTDLWRRATHIPGVHVVIDADRNVILRGPHGDMPVLQPLELAADLDTAAAMLYMFEPLEAL